MIVVIYVKALKHSLWECNILYAFYPECPKRAHWATFMHTHSGVIPTIMGIMNGVDIFSSGEVSKV